MKRVISFTIFILFSSIMFYAGCKDTITAEQVDSVVIPSSNVSYSKYIQPVLNLKCATAGCHDDITIAGGYSMTTWSNTTNPQFVVRISDVKGDTLTSRLVWAITGNPAVSPMPPLYSGVKPLTQNQIQGIITWVYEGAKDN